MKKANQALNGIKVVELAYAGVGPQITRELAEHGATVVRIESHRAPDPLRMMSPFKNFESGLNRSAFGACYNTQKYSISIDLNMTKGPAIAKQLVLWADVFLDGMTPGTTTKWGLDHESISAIKPDIIYAGTSQLGRTGPDSAFSGWGYLLMAMSGFTNITGRPERTPLNVVASYTDYIAPWYMVIALLGALDYRNRTGRGMVINQSQLESSLQFLSPALLDYNVNGRVMSRNANRHPYAAPHGVFPCRSSETSTEQWVAIAVFSDEEWQAFCRVIDKPGWIEDPKFAGVLGRKENEEELEELIAKWTEELPAEQIMSMMQNAGVAAGMVQSPEDLFNDPQVKHRNHFRPLEHQVIGRHSYNAPAYKLSKTPCDISKPGPCLGEDNEFVFKEILNMTDDDIEEFLVAGVITTEMDAPTAPSVF